MRIRLYRPQDVPAMAALWNLILEQGDSFPGEEPLTLEQAATFFAEQSASAVAEEGDQLMGLYVLHPNNIGRCSHVGNASYAVQPGLRGRGIGRALVRHSLDTARELGFRAMQFNAVVSTNARAIALYEQMGFQPIGRVREGFRLKDGSWVDTLLYRCDLSGEPKPLYQLQAEAFVPRDAIEACEQRTMLAWMGQQGDFILDRRCAAYHVTASGLIANPARDKLLMVHHNIYQSYCWSGGHTDGDPDPIAVALREAQEETGVIARLVGDRPVALNILQVPAHIKRGEPVPTHLHLNLAYLLIADPAQPIRPKLDENSAVDWIAVDQLETRVVEREMIPIYRRMLAGAQGLM
ncbi:MAG: GNAT family N-acetyltransferase [Christensenellales bacterium]|jgi:L-amino acid N-acyltransferase YncA/8-oxo-dGTP pyrophosphatase MutT (NUDIX family)